ncbi:MAG: lipopolysaccharide assembly protein LapA domain-containing protein [Candidatus Nanopelagicales bacterium]|jgi:uncharacterized integral membrane protein
MAVPGGKDGRPIPDKDFVQGKPQVVSGEAPAPPWRRWARFTAWVVLALIVLVFIFTNSQPVPVNFVIFRVDSAPLWIVLVVVLLIGIILGWMASWWTRRRRRANVRD